MRIILPLTFLGIASATTLVDTAGKVVRSAEVVSAGNGVVAKIGGSTGEISCEVKQNCAILSTCGASITGKGPYQRGAAASAAASVAGAIICEAEDATSLAESASGKSLSSIFGGKLLLDAGYDADAGAGAADKTLLLITVEGDDVDEKALMKDVEGIFEASAAAAGVQTRLKDLYSVEIYAVSDYADTAKVQARAAEGALSFPVENVGMALSRAYGKISTAPTALVGAELPSVTTAMLLCDDSYASIYRSARAKLMPWKGRVERGLLVDKFGTLASSLLEKTMSSYDVDTISAAGTPAAEYRLNVRAKLEARVEDAIRTLFESQIINLEKSTLKKFNASLLKQKNNKNEIDFDDNAAAKRSAAFAFDTAAQDLEVPSLSLRRAQFSQIIASKLDDALTNFSESNSAKMKDMMQIQKNSKKSKPSQRSLDYSLGLVAMIRPDGFGNLQGFAGYDIGPHKMIVGFHNDADAPETINQFGGIRPPLLRVQPKLNLDIEL